MIKSKKTSQEAAPNPSLLASLIVFSVYFAISFVTMPLTNMAYGDSDELITTAFSGGLGHPPGFPLFNFILHWFQKIPTGLSVAANSHLFSVLLASASVMLVFGLIYRMSSLFMKLKKVHPMFAISLRERLSISLLTTSAFGFSYLFFLYSHISEKYVFAVFLVTLSITALSYFELNHKKYTWALVAAILLGLSISHLQASVVLVPAYLYYFWSLRAKLTTKVSASLLSLFLVGLLAPLLLMIPMQNSASITWQFEPTLKGLAAMVTRQDFSGERYQQGRTASAYLSTLSLSKSATSLVGYTKTLIRHWGVVSFMLILAGFWMGVKLKHRIVQFVLFSFIGSGIVLIAYLTFPPDLGGQAILQRQYLLSSVFLALLFGFGVHFVYYRSKRFVSVLGVKEKLLPIILAVVALPIVVQSFININDGNLRHYTIASELYRQALESAPPNAVVVCFSDPSCFAMLYEQQANGLRTDTDIIPLAYPLIQKSGVLNTVKRFDYGDNPNQLLDIVSWNVHQERSVYAVDIGQYYHRYLGLENKILFYNPRTFFGTIEKQAVLEPVPEIPQIYQQAAAYKPPSRDLMRRFLHINFANAYVLNGMTYLHAGMRQEARDVLSFAANFYYQQGEAEKKEITGIRSNLEQIVIDPQIGVISESKDAAYYLDYSQRFKEAGNLNKAVQTAQAALIVEPQNVEARVKLAQLYELGGDARFAIKEYEHTLMLDPQNASASSAINRLTQISSPL
jgi:tetratricopeptide (TPR) repeat protein